MTRRTYWASGLAGALAGLAIYSVLAAGAASPVRRLVQEYRSHGAARRLAATLESRRLIDPANAVPGFPSDAVMLLAYMGRRQEGGELKWPRVAFAVGDGTVLLTAAHCVTDFDEKGLQARSPQTVLISPHYGDVLDFEIAAVDREADLAVLRAPWPAHPALALADDSELAAHDAEALLAGYPQPEKPGPPVHFARAILMERLPYHRHFGGPPNEAIMLETARFGGPGWSGAPVVLPRTGRVAGLLAQMFLRKNGETILRRDLAGADVRAIEALLKKAGLEGPARATAPALDDVPDADRAFALAVDHVEAGFNHDTTASLAAAQALVGLRPRSVHAHLFLAWCAFDSYVLDVGRRNLLPLAERHFREAIRLAPKNAQAQVGLGNFLAHQDRPKEALKALETAIVLDPDDPLALIDRLRVLNDLDPARALEEGRRLTELDAENPHFWYWYAAALSKQRQDEAAVEAARKAVELNPEGLYRNLLAQALARTNQLDEAEALFRRMTEDCGCQKCWFEYVLFLLNHRPDRLDEAEKAFAKVESETRRVRLAAAQISETRNRLIQERIEAVTSESPEKAEAMAREQIAVGKDPAHFWWVLADLLRSQNRHDEAAEAARKAVELGPDRFYQPRLADTLAKAGRLEESQETYDEMLRAHPERAKYWYWYAEFLTEHCPESVTEARRALARAEELTQAGPKDSWAAPAADLKTLHEKLAAIESTENTSAVAAPAAGR